MFRSYERTAFGAKIRAEPMQPQAVARRIASDDGIEDSPEYINRFERIAEKLYCQSSHDLPNKKSLDFLKSLGKLLGELESRGLLYDRDEVMQAAFCAIMYSIACIERSCDRRGHIIDTCITAFVNTATTIKEVSPGIMGYTYLKVVQMFDSSWRHYILANEVSEMTESEFNSKVIRLYSHYQYMPNIASDGGFDDEELVSTKISDYNSQ